MKLSFVLLLYISIHHHTNAHQQHHHHHHHHPHHHDARDYTTTELSTIESSEVEHCEVTQQIEHLQKRAATVTAFGTIYTLGTDGMFSGATAASISSSNQRDATAVPSTSITTSTAVKSTATLSSLNASVTNSATSSLSGVVSKATSVVSSVTSTVAAAVASATVGSTILIIGVDQTAVNQAINGLRAYGIPYQTLLVPQGGVALPTLQKSSVGNFGGIIVASGVSYDYGGSKGYASALTDKQWNALYAYQLAFGVRMVQWDVYPDVTYGTTAINSCCDDGVEQYISLTNTTAFTQAGIHAWANISTQSLYHYMAQIIDPSTTTEIAQFAPNNIQSTNTTAAVINDFKGRQQMVFFMSWATDWAPASNILQHVWITWITRGLYAGYRRVNFNTQIDDVFLQTGIYYSSTNKSPGNYRITTDDLDTIKKWVPTVQAKMNLGSWYKPEMGHNGNGNLIFGDPNGQCSTGPIYVNYQTTELEFVKPLGTGSDGWPISPSKYNYSISCLQKDQMMTWMSTPTNRDAFLHLSHTFTHEGQDNATYNDIYKEITWNQQWLKQTSIASGNFTPDGIIPPAITGLHNGDALRAWWAAGIRHSVGDNSRPLLRNSQNPHLPYITTKSSDGFDGMTIIPRWATRIYYNCDSPECTTQENIDTAQGTGDYRSLMLQERDDTNWRLFGLYHDGYMFHQLNLRSTGMSERKLPDGTTVKSLLQEWVEQAVQEFVRLANWPMITLKQSDLYQSYVNRKTRDACKYSLSYLTAKGKIIGVTVGATRNTCSAAIPVTVPGPVTDTLGFVTEKIGNDPLTIWVKLSGTPVTLTFQTPISM